MEKSLGVEQIKEDDLIEMHLNVHVETDGGIGLGLSPEGDGTVIHVKKGGNGEAAGVREYDMILGYMYAEEDDEFEDFVNMATFLDFMKEADGDPIVFKVSRYIPPSEVKNLSEEQKKGLVYSKGSGETTTSKGGGPSSSS